MSMPLLVAAPAEPAPVEYAVAVDRYLSAASLGAASRRVYRISLLAWAWSLAGRPVPWGTERRSAAPPVLPLAVVDDAETGPRLAAALAERAHRADASTVNREISALRSAIGWWQERGWVRRDPTAGLRLLADLPSSARPLTEPQLAELFRLPVGLRERAFWQLIHDSGASAEAVLALDAGAIDPSGCRVRPGRPATPAAGAAGGSGRLARSAGLLRWRAETADLLGWLLAGRCCGPVFLTDRRARAGTPADDVCPLTHRARMSYRRAAEIFTASTRPLDPAGHGWTLHQLR
jgi:integrase/recombinase XerD